MIESRPLKQLYNCHVYKYMVLLCCIRNIKYENLLISMAVLFSCGDGGKDSLTFFNISPNFYPFLPMIKMRKKMTVGFVLMRVSPTYENKVFDKLSKLLEVIEIHPLFGEYDFIAKVESVGYEHIGEIVNKIRTIEGITDTQTLSAIDY